MVKAGWGGRNDGETRMNGGAAEEEEEAKQKSGGTRRSRGREARRRGMHTAISMWWIKTGAGGWGLGVACGRGGGGGG
jgi:hypothetical protein